MKIKITITDDEGKEHEGTFDLHPKGSSHKDKIENTRQPAKSSSYKGLVGGITLLIDNEFFNNPKTANETHAQLKKETYYYSLKSVDGSLRKDFVSRRKTLTRIQDANVWKYVLRK